ncbi:carboxylating nicotinate-nucleotide diphosphorylase [Pseudonocardiaceae bacterium YIM PH 21723]|nr:carboxylating nicotinate-nucleotide diphosphorylase [Pseudonocardiaceae bacterium YIM PH 21723]
MGQSTVNELAAAGLDPADAVRLIGEALVEDLRYGPDVTTAATVPADATAKAVLGTRQAGVLAGLPLFLGTLDMVLGADGYQRTEGPVDGDTIAAGDVVLALRAPTRGLLLAERTALNLICHASGIATVTRRWVDAVAGTGAVIRDSRKTLPGLRMVAKHAVRCGGGQNHRMGLGDQILIKDNHVVAAGGVVPALKAAREYAPDLPCEIEVTSLEELDLVLAAGADLVLLDNFTPEQCAVAVERVRAGEYPAKLEASGGLTLDVAHAYASTGVDYVSVGGLTHSAPALDLGLDM